MAETEIPQDVRKLAAVLTRDLVGTSIGHSGAQSLAVRAIMADRASRAPDRDVLVEALRAGKAKISQRGSSNHGDTVEVYFPPYHEKEASVFAAALSAIEAAK